jgi:hypothetical protein
MKYWLYLTTKLLARVAVVCALELVLAFFYVRPDPPLPGFGSEQPPLFLGEMQFTFISLGILLIGSGLCFVVIWDQKRRCRACLRPLIMPVATGSWGHIVLFGQPRTEWICPYGHGTLSIAELQIAGRETPDWQPHDDNIWKELESYEARK